MPFPTPFADYEGEVQPGWIDSNDHMNMAYYVLMFDLATDAIYDAVGIGAGYKAATNCGTFAAETHVVYEQELLLGERARVTTRIIGCDAKRVHLAHEMVRISDGVRNACQEILFLHVDLSIRRVAPWPAAIFARLQEAASAHATLPPLPWLGRRIGLPARTPQNG